MGLTANMSWSTSGGYLSLSGSGLYRTITVTQYFSGTATVTCEWDYKLTGNGQYTHTKRQVTITCRDNQVSISPTSMTLSPGESKYVSYRHQYDNQYTSAANAYFQSSDPSICTVSSSGEVVAKNPGTTYINVYSKISSVSPYCKVTVEKVAPTSISIPSSLSMTGGDTKKITPTLYPSNAQSNFYWESSNTAVAKISNDGTISALQEGNSTITVRTDNGLSAECILTVKKGKLSLSSSTMTGWVEKGTQVSLYASQPNAKIFYTIDGSEPSISSEVYSYPFVVDKSLVIKAFAKCDGFYDSDVETFNYNIRDFVIQEITPTDNQSVNVFITPRITFNHSFQLSDECSNIVFQDNNGYNIPYSLYIGDNTLYICPKQKLEELKGYRVVVPENSIRSEQGESNKEMSLNFNTGSRVIKISYGTENAAIIKSDGSLWVWGNSRGGQLGDGNSSNKIIDTPIQILDNVIDVDMSYQRGLALKSDGSVWSWGRNDSGYVGNGNKQNQLTPINILNGISKIFCGESTSAAISESGNLYMWGSNYYGQIGDGTNTTALSPKKIMSNVNDISVRYDHAVASVGSNNSIYAWGHNCHKEIFTYGTYGQGVQVKTPWRLGGYYGHKVASTEGNTIFLDNSTVTLCGINNNGIFGNGLTDSYTTQKMLTPISNIKDIKSALYYILALDNNNTLWGWGDNEYGQIGCGHYSDVSKPYKILDNVEFFTAGYGTAAAILSNGDVYAWGQNNAYQLLGVETANKVSVPIKIFSGPSESAIESVRLIYSKNIISTDEQCACIPLITPIDASIASIEWSSSDESIATVDENGIVTGVEDGNVNITAYITGKDGNQFTTLTEISVDHNASVSKILSDKDYSVYVSNQSIIFRSSSPVSAVKLYSVDGMLIASNFNCTTSDFFGIKDGIYVLQVENKSIKIVVN